MADWGAMVRSEPAHDVPSASPVPATPEKPGETPLLDLARDGIAAVLNDPDAKPEARVAAARAVLDAEPGSPLLDLVDRALATLREVLVPGANASATAVVSAARVAAVKPPEAAEPGVSLSAILARLDAAECGEDPPPERPHTVDARRGILAASWVDAEIARCEASAARLDAKRAAQEQGAVTNGEGVNHEAQEKSSR